MSFSVYINGISLYRIIQWSELLQHFVKNLEWCVCLQRIDEQIMCMVGMGFELEDCQAAVENGKLSVDEAVEWSVLYKFLNLSQFSMPV